MPPVIVSMHPKTSGYSKNNAMNNVISIKNILSSFYTDQPYSLSPYSEAMKHNIYIVRRSVGLMHMSARTKR